MPVTHLLTPYRSPAPADAFQRYSDDRCWVYPRDGLWAVFHAAESNAGDVGIFTTRAEAIQCAAEFVIERGCRLEVSNVPNDWSSDEFFAGVLR